MSNYIDDQFTTIYCKYDIITLIAMKNSENDILLDSYNTLHSNIYNKVKYLGNILLSAKANGNLSYDEDYKSYIAYNFILYSDYYAGYCLDLTEPQEEPIEFFLGYFPMHYFESIYTFLYNILITYGDKTKHDELLTYLPSQLLEIVTSVYKDDGMWFFKSIDYHLPTSFLTSESLMSVKQRVNDIYQQGVEACIKLRTPPENMSACLDAYNIHIAASAAGGSIINNIMNKSKGKKQKNQRKHKSRKHKYQKQKNRRKHKSRKHKSRLLKTFKKDK